MMNAASSVGGEVDDLFLFLVLVSVSISLLVAVLIIYYTVRNRIRAGHLIGDQNSGSTTQEVFWITSLMGLSLIMFGWGAKVYYDLYSPPAQALTVFVMAKQWMWKFQHQTGPTEINDLHVPLGRDVRLIMGTEDVIHSFYVPAFRLKMDVVPGRYRTAWFHATRVGTYHLFCAEYCGTNHSGMGGWIHVVPDAEYQAWLRTGPTLSMAAQGEILFQHLGCTTCHHNDRQWRGPVLRGLYGRPVLLRDGKTVLADESYIRESILDPAAKIVAGFEPLMPVFQGLVTDQQVNQLVAYIRSLGEPAQAGSPYPQGVPPAPTSASPLTLEPNGPTPFVSPQEKR